MNNVNSTPVAAARDDSGGGVGEKGFHLGIRLQPVEHSDQPVFSNFAMVQGASGMVFLDFGFLEPSVLPTVVRLAQKGGELPETVNGRLAARVVLGLDAAAQLARQLDQYLRSVSEQAQRRTAAPASLAS
jgi:hypothetical protein